MTIKSSRVLLKWTVTKAPVAPGGQWHVLKPHRVYNSHWVGAFRTQAEAMNYARMRAERDALELRSVDRRW
jgi:hypothetical protein